MLMTFRQAQSQAGQEGPVTKSSGPATILGNTTKSPMALSVKAGSRNIHQPNVASNLAYKGIGDAFTRIYTEEGCFFFKFFILACKLTVEIDVLRLEGVFQRSHLPCPGHCASFRNSANGLLSGCERVPTRSWIQVKRKIENPHSNYLKMTFLK